MRMLMQMQVVSEGDVDSGSVVDVCGIDEVALTLSVAAGVHIDSLLMSEFCVWCS